MIKSRNTGKDVSLELMSLCMKSVGRAYITFGVDNDEKLIYTLNKLTVLFYITWIDSRL